jgi:hypothetical protein
MIHIYNKYLAHTFSSTCSLASVVKQPIQSIYYIYNNNKKKLFIMNNGRFIFYSK